MAYVKWTLYGLVILAVAAFFHYTLPQHDVVRIVDIDVTRMDAGTDAQGQPVTRDVRFIYAVFPDGDEIEYRNEDTDWGFPFYFKFDSARLANQAANLKSTAADPVWVVLTHYGWRVPVLSMFPNALSVRPAEGPDEEVLPWFTIIFVTVLVIGFLVLRRIFIILRRRHVDPVVAEMDRGFDERAAWWRGRWRRLRGRR